MIRNFVLTFAGLLPLSAQAPGCSARAIFIGEKGAIPPACQAAQVHVARHPKSAGEPKPADPGPIAVQASYTPAMSALRYWIELIKPTGELQTVNTDRIFHSGEKVRLHLQSSAAGRLMIAQRNPDGSSKILFPDARINNGDSLIAARTDTAIPSSGYFRFDNETGIEQLLVILNPGASPASPDTLLAVQQSGAASPEETERRLGLASSKRGLILEVDKTESYVAGPGQISVEIRLQHR